MFLSHKPSGQTTTTFGFPQSILSQLHLPPPLSPVAPLHAVLPWGSPVGGPSPLFSSSVSPPLHFPTSSLASVIHSRLLLSFHKTTIPSILSSSSYYCHSSKGKQGKQLIEFLSSLCQVTMKIWNVLALALITTEPATGFTTLLSRGMRVGARDQQVVGGFVVLPQKKSLLPVCMEFWMK